VRAWLLGAAIGWLAGCATPDFGPMPPGEVEGEPAETLDASLLFPGDYLDSLSKEEAEEPLGQGVTLLQDKDYVAAIPYLERALHRQPENVLILEALSLCLYQTGQLDRITDLWERHLEQQPDSPKADEWLARVHEARIAPATEQGRSLAGDEEMAESMPLGEDPYYSGYLLQTGDEIDIQIYRELDLSGPFRITPAGDIRHPLVGAVPVAGKTLKQAEADFTALLARDFLVNPRVIFKMLSTQSSQIVLLGEVRKPGVYPLPVGEPITLLQAVAGAGGFTDLASPDRVRIVRRLPDGRTTTIRVRVSRLLSGRGRQEDMTLEANDVIMVPEVLF